MNRGSPQRPTDADGGRAASMRPRFMNRGSSDFHLARRPARARFNEAPIHESGKCIAAENSEEWSSGLQ